MAIFFISVDCNSVSRHEIGFSACFPYGVDDGPCIFDKDCKDDLFCGYKNCPDSFGNEDANCCGRNQFKSPNYPTKYFPNDEVTWLLTASLGFIIHLQFNYFQVRLRAKSFQRILPGVLSQAESSKISLNN